MVLVSALLVGGAAQARNAGLLLSPTRVVFENGKRYAVVTLKNNGDGAGRYVVELVDATMDENGGIKLLAPGVKRPDSALDIVSISPHSITLRPDDYQTIRVLVKNLSGMPDGEYRSHLAVRMTQADLIDDTIKPDVQNTVIAPKALLSTVIPVIVRNGDAHYVLTINDVKLVMAGADKQIVPQIAVSMNFSGNRSVIGDFKVTHVAPDGKATQLAFFRGVAIYRDVSKRQQLVSLEVPGGVNIHKGTIDVAFLSQDGKGSVIAEKSIKAQ
jgi:hypothetical protein